MVEVEIELCRKPWTKRWWRAELKPEWMSKHIEIDYKGEKKEQHLFISRKQVILKENRISRYNNSYIEIERLILARKGPAIDHILSLAIICILHPRTSTS